MRYVEEFDGIRGVSIALVVLFHFGYLPAGWIGVQVFFVLSGYLITSILLHRRDATLGGYLGRFYWRRMLRIFPLYYFVLLATAIVYGQSGSPQSFPNDWPWLLGYVSNFARLRAGDLPTYVHTWSLAVEEQFYLIWPLVIYYLASSKLKTTIAAILIGVPLLRLATFQTLLAFDFDQNFAGRAVLSLPFTQFDAFAAGAAIAVFQLERLLRPGRWFFLVISVAAIGGLTVLMLDHVLYGSAFIGSLGFAHFMIGHHEYVWGYSLINAIAALGIICSLQKVWFTRILHFPGCLRLGKISYGVYVYHFPLLQIGLSFIAPSNQIERIGFFVGWVAATIVIAEVSFRYLEQPFLRLKDAVKF